MHSPLNIPTPDADILLVSQSWLNKTMFDHFWLFRLLTAEVSSVRKLTLKSD